MYEYEYHNEEEDSEEQVYGYRYDGVEQFSGDDDFEKKHDRGGALLNTKEEGSPDSTPVTLSLENNQHKSSTQAQGKSAIQRLHEIKRIGLRGGGGGGGSQDAVALITEVAEIANPKLTNLQVLLDGGDGQIDPKSILDGIISDSNDLDQLPDLKGRSHRLDLSTLHEMDKDISREDLSSMFKMIQQHSNIDLKAHVQSTADLLERARIEMLSITNKTGRKGRRLDEDQGQDQEPDGPFASFNFGPRGSQRFNPRTGRNQQIRTILRDAYSEGRTRVHRRNKHKKHTSNNRRRRHLEESGTCPMPCDMNDILCNCQKLYDCASEISPYDLSVMFLHG